MTAEHDADPRARDRVALERTWLAGRRLIEAQRSLRGTLPISPEQLVEFDNVPELRLDTFLVPLRETRLDAYLFRLGAALTAFIEEAVETVLMAESEFYLPIRLTADLRDLERCGAIPSADQVLDLHERVRRHYLIATFAPEERAEALNQAWADGEEMITILVQLSQHIQTEGLIPGLRPFEPDPP